MMRRVLLLAGVVVHVGLGSAVAHPKVPVTTETTALFGFEKAQLTEETLSTLDTVFHFDNGDDSILDGRGASPTCKVFPGDSAWPSTAAWTKLGQAVGQNALIKTVPLASPCYNGAYYNAAKCSALVANWTSSYLQYVT
jgi:hypothetical protein